MAGDDEKPDEERGADVIVLHPPPPDRRDEGETLTVRAMGLVVQFREPPTRTKEATPPPDEQVVYFHKKRRWEWSADEDKAHFSVRCGEGGENIVFAFENPGQRGVYEVWLPFNNVSERGFETSGFGRYTLMGRMHRVLGAARESLEENRRSPAKRETVDEAVGVGGHWTLVRGELERKHGERRRIEVFWEVTGGPRPKRIYSGGTAEDNEKKAREDFAQHKPPWKCGASPPNVAPDPAHPGWRRYVFNRERCGRKAGHSGNHRNREGMEWEADAATGAVLSLPLGKE